MNTNSFRDYVAIVRRRLWVVLLLFAATMSIILARAWSTPPAYSASVSLQVMPLESTEVPLFTRTTTTSTTDPADLVMFQFEIAVRSQSVALRTIADTDIDIRADALLKGVGFRREPGGDVVTVSVEASNPQDAERLITAHVANALDALRTSRTRPLVTTGEFLNTELANATQAVTAARNDLLQFRLANNLSSLEKETQAEQDQIRALRSAQEAAGIEARRLTAMAEELERQSKAARTKAAAAPQDSADAVRWTRLADELEQTAISRRVDAAGQSAIQSSYYAILNDHENNLATWLTLGEKYQQLQDAITEKEDRRDFLAGKVREADLKESQNSSIGYLQVIGMPNTARAPLATHMVEIALLGGVLSLLVGVALVFFLEFLARVVRPAPSAEDGRA